MVLKFNFKTNLPNSNLMHVFYNITISDQKTETVVSNQIITAQENIHFEKLYNHEYVIEMEPIVKSKCGSLCPFMKNDQILCEKCTKRIFFLTNSRDEKEGTECQL
jgi:hypothetical protein